MQVFLEILLVYSTAVWYPLSSIVKMMEDYLSIWTYTENTVGAPNEVLKC